ncbi:MAG: c-type cytochrome [Deltaproteobacteria bacterium]|nr:c-type cytochrome [Deltaproteobacteria bacterium]
MKRAVLPVLLLAAACGGGRAVIRASAEQGARLVQSAAGVPSHLACAHCHANTDELRRGERSPGPGWPGMAGNGALKGIPGMSLVDAVTRCAMTYQARSLSPAQAADMAAWIAEQGDAPTVPRVEEAAGDPTAEAFKLAPDMDRGQEVWGQACARCHDDGPGPPARELQTQARLEILQKIYGTPPDLSRGMPAWTRATLPPQDAADVAAWLHPGM